MTEFSAEKFNPYVEEGRKKIRYRKKFKKKKKGRFTLKKVFEYFIWIVLIGAFVTSVVILVKHLDITDKTVRDKRKKEKTRLDIQRTPASAHNKTEREISVIFA